MPIPSTLYVGPPRERWFALLIGIRYLSHPNRDAHLERPHADVDLFRKLLIANGCLSDNITVLADRDGHVDPTRANIILYIKQLVQRAIEDPTRNYRLTFYYAGHGDQEPDPKKKEKDGMNETIVPMDAKFDVKKTRTRGGEQVTVCSQEDHGYIIDDELNELMAKPLPAGSRLRAFFDCCHAGTALDLKYEYFASHVPWLYRRFFFFTMPRTLKLILMPRKEPKQSSAEQITDPAGWPFILQNVGRTQTLPAASRLTRALGLAPDDTLAAGVNLVVSTSRWTFAGAAWIWRLLFCHPPADGIFAVNSLPTMATAHGPEEQGISTQFGCLCSAPDQLRDLPENGDRSTYGTTSNPRSVQSLEIGTVNYLVSTQVTDVLHLTENVRVTEEDNFVAADVIALGACSDGQEGDDSESLAKVLDHLVRNYGGNLTYAELLLCLSRRVEPQKPELSSSHEMCNRWGELFTL